MIGLSRPRRLGLWALNLVSIAFLILPLVPVVLGSLQSEKSMQKDVRALLPSEVTLATSSSSSPAAGARARSSSRSPTCRSRWSSSPPRSATA